MPRLSPITRGAVLVVFASIATLPSGCECDAPTTPPSVARDRTDESPSGASGSVDDTERDDDATRRRDDVAERRREARRDGTQEATEWLSDFARE